MYLYHAHTVRRAADGIRDAEMLRARAADMFPTDWDVDVLFVLLVFTTTCAAVMVVSTPAPPQRQTPLLVRGGA